MTIGAVVVGTGFGARVHVPALRAAGFEVRALGRARCRNEPRVERSGSGSNHACTSLADALALGGVDAVTIAAPPNTHAALAIEACEAGRHVICEKPFALDAAEAEAMTAAAAGAGVTALVGHEFRWAPDRATAARAIDDGPDRRAAAGDARAVRPARRRSRTYASRSGGSTRPRGGGWLGASGSHIVDQVRTWFGELGAVERDAADRRRAAGAEDSFVVRASSRSGVDIVMQQTAASWTPGVAGLTVVAGADGTLEVDAAGVWCSDRSGRRLLDTPEDLVLPPSPAATDDPRHRYTHLELGPYTRLCEALRAGIEGDEPPTRVPAPTFADGLACMRVLDAIRASAAADGAVVAVSR